MKIITAVLGFWMVLGMAAGTLLAAEGGAEDKSGGVFPNDFGPKEIDVSKYPDNYKATYTVFKAKCSACHTIARPINSQFLELTPEELSKAKADQPELFSDKNVVQPEEKVWSRYVKRMMSKPGCPVGKDGKAIYEFLNYDSHQRKTGTNTKAWIAQRKKLLEDFKASNPARYAELFGGQTPQTVKGAGGDSGGKHD